MSQVPPYRLPASAAQKSQELAGVNCPSCGAGYKVGLSACEYCRTPVRARAAPIGSYIAFREDGTALIKRFATGGMVPKDMLAYVHQGEAIVPRMIDERFRI